MIAALGWFAPGAGAQTAPQPGQLPAPMSNSTPQSAAVTMQPAPAAATAAVSNVFRPLQPVASAVGAQAVSTAPGSGSFPPFRSTVTIQYPPGTGTSPAPVNQLASEELRKKQIEEIRALRESLKGQPESVISKAVKAKKAEQNAAVRAQQGAGTDKTGKPKKGRLVPIKY
jgi:hypothetical protein